jgi:hypothetical protein
MTAGNEMANGSASSLTDRPGSRASRITSARRVGSDRAAKVRSRAGSKNLTIWFSIRRQKWSQAPCKGRKLINPLLSALIFNRRAMDAISLIPAFLGAQTGKLQLAVAARLERMNVQNNRDIANLVGGAQQSGRKLADAAAGIGANLDVSA